MSLVLLMFILYFICLLLLLCHFFTFLCHFDRSTYYSLLKESIADSVLVRLEFSIKKYYYYYEKTNAPQIVHSKLEDFYPPKNHYLLTTALLKNNLLTWLIGHGLIIIISALQFECFTKVDFFEWPWRFFSENMFGYMLT